MQKFQQKLQKFYTSTDQQILKIIPQQFIGIAKKYSVIKKSRQNNQKIFDNYFHEVRSMQKINKNLQKILNKKKKQLHHVQTIHTRYVTQLLQKQKLDQLKSIELLKLKTKTNQNKTILQLKTSKSKEQSKLNKKNQYNHMKKQLDQFRTQRITLQSQMHQKNYSKVKQIQSHKIKVKNKYQQYIINKNKKYMENYNLLINDQKKSSLKFQQQLKSLTKKLLCMKDQIVKKKKQIGQVDMSIDTLKQSRHAKCHKNHLSTRSMTPFQILSNQETSQTEPCEKPKENFV